METRFEGQLIPGFASFLLFMFAFEGIMNLSRNDANRSAASRDAAYTFDPAFSGKTGLEDLTLDIVWTSVTFQDYYQE